MASKKIIYAELMLVIVTVFWGIGFSITKIAVNMGYGTNTIMVGRFLTASIILSIVYYKKLKNINKTILLYGILTGFFLFFSFYFQTLGNAYTTPSKNGFITQLNIVFVPFLYYLFFRRKVDIYNIVSIIVAIFGMFLLSFNSEGFKELNIGDIYTFFCAIMVAFHVVSASYFQKKYDFDPALFVLVNILTSMVISVIFMLFFETIPKIVLSNVWPLLFLGLFNTAIGFLVQSYALKISLPTRVSLIVALEAVFAVIGSWLIVGEIITIQIAIGGFLIISGILITELKPFKGEKLKIE
ncbi:MAG: DMT family transporter [Candidatus Izimaplasma sp.]|nr:DMT family transporter [Candidatus Izimaplasma bacterium]